MFERVGYRNSNNHAVQAFELKITEKIHGLFSDFIKYPDNTTYQQAKLKVYDGLLTVIYPLLNGLIVDTERSEIEKITLLEHVHNEFKQKCEMFLNNPELIYAEVEDSSNIPFLDSIKGYVRTRHEKNFFKDINDFILNIITFLKRLIALHKKITLKNIKIKDLHENIYSIIVFCRELKLEYSKIHANNFSVEQNEFSQDIFFNLSESANIGIIRCANQFSVLLLNPGQSLEPETLRKISNDLAAMYKGLLEDMEKIKASDNATAALINNSISTLLMPASLAYTLYLYRKKSSAKISPLDMVMIYDRFINRIVSSQANNSRIDLYSLFSAAIKSGLLINKVVELYKDWLQGIDIESLTPLQVANVSRSKNRLEKLTVMTVNTNVRKNFELLLLNIYSDFSAKVYSSPRFMQLQKFPISSLSDSYADLFTYIKYTPFNQSVLYRVIQMLTASCEMTGNNWSEKVKKIRNDISLYLNQLRYELKFCLPYFLTQFANQVQHRDAEADVLLAVCMKEAFFKKLRLTFHPDHCEFEGAGEMLTGIESWLEKVNIAAYQLPDDPIIMQEDEALKQRNAELRKFVDKQKKDVQELEARILEMRAELEALRSNTSGEVLSQGAKPSPIAVFSPKI